MINGKAYKLGDVLTASNGKTVEIDNTDAEGRLTLADALVYASKLSPTYTFDFATLTGACIIALGPHIAGVMSHDDELTGKWMAAAERAGEDMWRLPLPEALKEQLKSPIADMRNTGERWGGTITAGLFLSEFTEGMRWVHVDIAGPAMVRKPFGVNDEGGSGFAVATILEFLRCADRRDQLRNLISVIRLAVTLISTSVEVPSQSRLLRTYLPVRGPLVQRTNVWKRTRAALPWLSAGGPQTMNATNSCWFSLTSPPGPRRAPRSTARTSEPTVPSSRGRTGAGPPRGGGTLAGPRCSGGCNKISGPSRAISPGSSRRPERCTAGARRPGASSRRQEVEACGAS
jgi:hypothetical protein